MSAVERVSRQVHVTRGPLTLSGAAPRSWLGGFSTGTAMPHVVKKEVKTSTKRSPDNPDVEIVTTETTETMDDGSTCKTIKTETRGAGLNTFHEETRKALEDSKHGNRRRSSSSSSDDGKRHHRRHRSRSSSAEKKKGGGLLSKFKKTPKSRSPSPKASKSKKEKESKSKHRHRSSSSDSSSDDEGHFEEDCISAHNDYRKKHGAPPLERSKKLTKLAKEWAKQLAKDDKMSHRKDNSDGENIYCKWSSNPKHKVKGREAVESWYAEIKDHDFTKEPSPGVLKSGHFSQVVWLSTRQVGVAKARSKSGRVYVVANYSPAGNFLGDYCDNVPPVGGFPAGFKPKREAPRVEKKKSKSKHRSSSSSSDSSSDEEEFAEECLKAHNEYRKKHGVSSLKLNKKMCKYSQEWAETIAKKDVMEHRSDKKYGENIFCVWSDDPKFRVRGREAVESWYNEIKDHKFGVEPAQGVIKSGHFSQVVWKESKELGVGRARSKSGKIMVVANYDPAGNFIGDFTKNVPKPR